MSILLLSGCESESEERLIDANGEVRDWSTYYDSQEVYQIKRQWAEHYPALTDLRNIGESYDGRDLLVMAVSNMENEPPEEKPGFYLDGSVHGQELTGYMVALYFLNNLLSRYGDDPDVTELLDTRVIYVNTIFNPDGVDTVLADDQFIRSSVRPIDLNEDGIPDSDPPEDLTGNNRILQMRVPDPEGGWKKSEEDSRIMVRRGEEDSPEASWGRIPMHAPAERDEEYDGPFYQLVREGIDRNQDGTINSDPKGGIDMNRNFPRNWERWHKQPGSGDFPLSEPETRAVADFINDHRNINFIVAGHTAGLSGGFVYRLPSAMDPRDFDSKDEALVQALGEYYTEYTDIDRPFIPSADEPGDHRYGTLIQWGYSDLGAIGYVPEYSPPPRHWVPDYADTGNVTEADWHRFNDEEFDGYYFSEWEPYDHPQLGEVEIGGWWTRFWGQNPPHALLEQELEVQVPWLLYLARQTPSIQIEGLEVQPVNGDRYVVEIEVANTGYLATHVTEQGYEGRQMNGNIHHQIVKPPLIVLEIDGIQVESMEAGAVQTRSENEVRLRLPHLAGSNPYTDAVTNSLETIRMTVQKTAPSATVELTVSSEKAGTDRERLVW